MWIVDQLWLIPSVPLAAALVAGILRGSLRKATASVVIIAMLFSTVLSFCALFHVIGSVSAPYRTEVMNFAWFTCGSSAVQLGFLLDPLSAAMLCAVSLIGLLVLVYAVGFMEQDPDCARFDSLASFLLGTTLLLVMSNSLVLLIVAWELIGMASCLLIALGTRKTAGAAAMQRAFMIPRIGDLALFLGLIWLYGRAGTALFQDRAQGILDGTLLATMDSGSALGICLLILLGVMGRSAQFPLHGWLADTAEIPSPSTALIHSATTLVAGILVIARLYPIFQIHPAVLPMVTCAGMVTLWFAASVAVGQRDFGRVLVFLSMFQVGSMLISLGVGKLSTGLFQLLINFFVMTLLLLGAGSIRLACNQELDIRKVSGLGNRMPWTTGCLVIAGLTFAGAPFFAGFFSRLALILESHHLASRCNHWAANLVLVLVLAGTALAVFSLTRPLRYLFGGTARAPSSNRIRESSWWMVGPMVILALLCMVGGFLGVPNCNLVEHFLGGETTKPPLSWWLISWSALGSTVCVAGTVICAWILYPGDISETVTADPLEKCFPRLFLLSNHGWGVNNFLERTMARGAHGVGRMITAFDQHVLHEMVAVVCTTTFYFAFLVGRLAGERVFGRGFKKSREAWHIWREALCRAEDHPGCDAVTAKDVHS